MWVNLAWVKLLLFDHLHYSEFSRSHTDAHSSTSFIMSTKTVLSRDGCMAATSEAAVVKVNSSMGELYVAGTAVLILYLWFLVGDWVHHSGPSPAATSHMPKGSVWLDAGLLATGASHEAQHQRNPLPPSELGQGISSLLGYFRLKSPSISSSGLWE